MERDGSNPLVSPPELTPLEQQVIDEYERLAENMKKVKNTTSLPPLVSTCLLSPTSPS